MYLIVHRKMREFEYVKHENSITKIKNYNSKKYFKVLLEKSVLSKLCFCENFVEIVGNLCFDSKAEIISNSIKKEVFILGMKTSTMVTIGDP